MRQCCQCGVEDRELMVTVHLIVPEIRYLAARESLTPRLARQGWCYRRFQGRHAMERMICRPCLRANEARDRVWAKIRQEALAVEKGSADADNYYEILCEV